MLEMLQEYVETFLGEIKVISSTCRHSSISGSFYFAVKPPFKEGKVKTMADHMINVLHDAKQISKKTSAIMSSLTCVDMDKDPHQHKRKYS